MARFPADNILILVICIVYFSLRYTSGFLYDSFLEIGNYTSGFFQNDGFFSSREVLKYTSGFFTSGFLENPKYTSGFFLKNRHL